jgi:PPOX class probable F420-dependent enzyme
MLPSERRAFVHTHRTCVFGYRRKNDGPGMSVVYYVPTDDDELLVSTMAGRGKARVIARDGKVSLCVLDENWPFAYLQVYADAVIEDDPELVCDVMMAVAGRMLGQALPEEARAYVDAMRVEENRVVMRCRPYETFASPLGIGHRAVGCVGPGLNTITRAFGRTDDPGAEFG